MTTTISLWTMRQKRQDGIPVSISWSPSSTTTAPMLSRGVARRILKFEFGCIFQAVFTQFRGHLKSNPNPRPLPCRTKRNNGGPAPLDQEELKQALQFCAVFQPLKLATKLLEGEEKALGSVYLPVWNPATSALELKANNFLPLPKELQGYGKGFKVRELAPLPKDLLVYMHKDMQAISKKHFCGSSGELLLRAASFLDPRFKSHLMWSDVHLDQFRKTVHEMAMEACQEHPALVAKLKQQSANLGNQFLFALADTRPAKQKGRARGRGRGRGGGSQPARSASAKILAKSASADSSAPPLQLASAPASKRVLRERTSAEEWLFGQQAQTEESVIEEVQELNAVIDTELARCMVVQAPGDMNFGPLQFWSSQAPLMPYLAALASQIFAIPASTAALERLFSAAGRAIGRRRPRLTSKRASAMIFGHANVVNNISPLGEGGLSAFFFSGCAGIFATLPARLTHRDKCF